jgi:hypothetical protein
MRSQVKTIDLPDLLLKIDRFVEQKPASFTRLCYES